MGRITRALVSATLWLPALAACQPLSWAVDASYEAATTAGELVDAPVVALFTVGWTPEVADHADALYIEAEVEVAAGADFRGLLRMVPSDASLPTDEVEIVHDAQEIESETAVDYSYVLVDIPLEACEAERCEMNFSLEIEGHGAAVSDAEVKWRVRGVAWGEGRAETPAGAELTLERLE